MTGIRQEVVEIVASRVRALPRPARVAVDGVTAAGKSTFADELVALAGGERVTIDDFHRPPPQEYYPSSFDFDRFREHLDRPRLRTSPRRTP